MSCTACKVINDVDAVRLLVAVDDGNVGLVTLRLHRDVPSSASVRQRVLSGDLHGALVRPRMVGGILCAISACRSAILSHGRHCMKTRSLATEIIYNLAPHTKISAALQQFGIQDGDTDVLSITVDFVPPNSGKIDALGERFTPDAASNSGKIDAGKESFTLDATSNSGKVDAGEENVATNTIQNLGKIGAVEDSFTPNAVKMKDALGGEVVDVKLLDDVRDEASLTKLYKLTKQELQMYDIERCCVSRMACKGI